MLVGVGQRRFRRRRRQPQMVELALGGAQTLRDLGQAVRPAQLTEQHGHELAPAGEAAGVALGMVLLHRLLEFAAGEQLQELAEYAAYSVHGRHLRQGKVVLVREPTPP